MLGLGIVKLPGVMGGIVMFTTLENTHRKQPLRRSAGVQSVGLVSALMFGIFASGQVLAASTEVAMAKVDAQGKSEKIGSITIEEIEHGLLFTPDLESLPGGMHGFHVHQHGSCDPAHKEGEMSAAESAGGHFDPDESGKHLGPYGEGHLGDLPALYVDEDGNAQTPVLAPRLKTLDQLEGRALMIHAGGDNYADEPEPLGGGGARVACGVI